MSKNVDKHKSDDDDDGGLSDSEIYRVLELDKVRENMIKKEASIGMGFILQIRDVDERMVWLRKDIEFNHEMLEKWLKENFETPPSELSPVKKDEINLIISRIRLATITFKKLDIEFMELREKINQHYGKELMKVPKLMDCNEILNGLEEVSKFINNGTPPDKSDWWKNYDDE